VATAGAAGQRAARARWPRSGASPVAPAPSGSWWPPAPEGRS
jgi:hypothetical protein